MDSENKRIVKLFTALDKALANTGLGKLSRNNFSIPGNNLKESIENIVLQTNYLGGEWTEKKGSGGRVVGYFRNSIMEPVFHCASIELRKPKGKKASPEWVAYVRGIQIFPPNPDEIWDGKWTIRHGWPTLKEAQDACDKKLRDEGWLLL